MGLRLVFHRIRRCPDLMAQASRVRAPSSACRSTRTSCCCPPWARWRSPTASSIWTFSSTSSIRRWLSTERYLWSEAYVQRFPIFSFHWLFSIYFVKIEYFFKAQGNLRVFSRSVQMFISFDWDSRFVPDNHSSIFLLDAFHSISEGVGVLLFRRWLGMACAGLHKCMHLHLGKITF